ncbi:acyltransferase domain-containing protein, partial [Vibrio parahaemolyticus]
MAGSLFTPKNDSSAERLVEMTTRLAKTEIAQPALVLTSVLYAEWLKAAGVYPSVVGGNSLGELVAFHLAGAFDQQTLFRAAVLRGQLMK